MPLSLNFGFCVRCYEPHKKPWSYCIHVTKKGSFRFWLLSFSISNQLFLLWRWSVKEAVGSVKCEVWSVKEAVGSEKCEVWSVKFQFGVRRAQCEVWSVKCEVWSVKEAVRSEKCEVWTVKSVKCKVWSVRFGVWRKQWEVWSVECEVWSVECEVWSVKFEVWSAKSAVCSVRCGVPREGHGRDSCLWTIGHLCLGNFRRRLARVYVTGMYYLSTSPFLPVMAHCSTKWEHVTRLNTH